MIETKRSEALTELAKALSAAQSEMKNAPKSGMGNYGPYSTIADCLEVIRDTFSKHGLSVIQLPKVDEHGCHLETLLLHNSGEFIQSVLSCRPMSLEPQKIGSAITYMRRYSLTAILGLASEDDDGHESSNGKVNFKAQNNNSDQSKSDDVPTAPDEAFYCEACRIPLVLKEVKVKGVPKHVWSCPKYRRDDGVDHTSVWPK